MDQFVDQLLVGHRGERDGRFWRVVIYVRPEARGTGLAAALVQQVVAHARPLVEEVCLTVVASNVAARSTLQRGRIPGIRLERRAATTQRHIQGDSDAKRRGGDL
jgi:GNAT superfamily N-acetyltransferase